MLYNIANNLGHFFTQMNGRTFRNTPVPPTEPEAPANETGGATNHQLTSRAPQAVRDAIVRREQRPQTNTEFTLPQENKSTRTAGYNCRAKQPTNCTPTPLQCQMPPPKVGVNIYGKITGTSAEGGLQISESVAQSLVSAMAPSNTPASFFPDKPFTTLYNAKKN